MQNTSIDHPRRADSFSSALFLGVMTMGYAVYAIDRYVLSAVLSPMSSALHLSSTEVGLIGSAQYIGVLCLVFFAGYLSDRYGRMRIIISGIVIFSAFTWLIGLSSSFGEAFLFRLISGFGEGMFWPTAMAAVATNYGKNKGLSLGIFYVGFDAGGAAGLSIGGISFYLTHDWRTAFFVAPLLGLLVIGGTYAYKNWFNSRDDPNKIGIGRDALKLLRKKRMVLLGLFALLATWSSVWQVVFLPYYFNKVLGLSVALAAFASTIVTISGGAGKITLGWASDRWKRNWLLAGLSLVVVLSYLLFFSSSASVLLLLASVLMGFFSAAIFPILQSLVVDTSKDRPGTALGISTTAQSIATVVSPIIAASLFSLGVGRAIAYDAMIPAVISIPVAIALSDTR